MSVTTLSAIENGDRRADVDDLVAIAAALDISPAAMLMPAVADPHEAAGRNREPRRRPQRGRWGLAHRGRATRRSAARRGAG